MLLHPAPSLPRRLARHGFEVAPGAAVCAGIAAVATVIGRFLPAIGGVLPAVAIGVVLALVRRPGAVIQPGVGYASRFLLQLAVVLLGAQLSLGSIARVGLASLPVMVASLAVCLLAAWLLGRRLRIEPGITTLIGVGTGVCGASAIAAISPVIAATEAEVAYAVSTIFLFNIAAVVLFPLLGHALHLPAHAFGLLAGTAVNDTSSVVATAGAYSTAALGFAVTVKLARTLMIIPISVGLALRTGDPADRGALTPFGVLRLVPWFLIGFLLVAALNSVGGLPTAAHAPLSAVSAYLIATAMAGIGLSTDAAAVRRAGWRPLALGAALWVITTATSLGVMHLTGAI